MTRRITHITALILSLLSLSLHAQNLNESVIEPLNESLDKPHDELPDNQPLVLDIMTTTDKPAYRWGHGN